MFGRCDIAKGLRPKDSNRFDVWGAQPKKNKLGFWPNGRLRERLGTHHARRLSVILDWSPPENQEERNHPQTQQAALLLNVVEEKAPIAKN